MALRIPDLIRERLQGLADRLREARKEADDACAKASAEVGVAIDPYVYRSAWLESMTKDAGVELTALLKVTAPRRGRAS